VSRFTFVLSKPLTRRGRAC